MNRALRLPRPEALTLRVRTSRNAVPAIYNFREFVMKRREFITLLGGAATWPLAARARQRVLPVVVVLCAGTAQALERYLASFREGMRRLGYVDGSNVHFEFRFADGYLDRLPDLAIELVGLNSRIIVSTPLPAPVRVTAWVGAS